MRRIILFLLLMTLPKTIPAAESPLAKSDQLVLVITKGWNSIHGDLFRFHRKNGAWEFTSPKFTVALGRNGIGRGRGLNSSDLKEGPEKKEGDGKSPAGAFRLSSAFGYAPKAEVDYIKMPYAQCTGTLECVDDVQSTNYNSIVDRKSLPKVDWKSSEQMLMKTDEYRLGLVVDHNVEPRVPGGGSCIFLHIWKDRGAPTSGCTSMSETNMVKLLHWLKPDLNPMLVQLPENEFKRLQKDWDLPMRPPSKKTARGNKKKPQQP